MIFIFAFQSADDQNKFERIYLKYRDLLLYKSFEILKDSMLAEDAVSEAFIRIYRNLHKIDDPDSNRTIAFVVTIVKNTSLTLSKKEKKMTVEVLEESEQDQFNLEKRVLTQVRL